MDAIKPLRYYIGEILDELLEISENTSEWDGDTTHKTYSLALKIQNYKFMCSIIIWFDILNEINSVSKMMQNPGLNVKLCIDCLKNLIKHITNYRTDDNFSKVLVESKKIAIAVNAEPNFPPTKSVRSRRKPKTFEYEQRDEVVVDPKYNFKIEFLTKF